MTEPINAFDKLTFEAEFQHLSPGGAISYVETSNLSGNIEAVLAVIRHIYDNIIYAELNTKSDYCQVCGWDGEIDIVNMLMNLMFGDKNGFEPMTDEEISEAYNTAQLPVRATSGSAGYDIKAPFSFLLRVGQSIKIPTGLRVKIDEGWWLGCFPRSGLGFKYTARLANTVGVIDADYYGSKNEGHIMIKLCNEGSDNIIINAGDAFAQAIFIPFGITTDDEASGVRDGGFGSTGR